MLDTSRGMNLKEFYLLLYLKALKTLLHLLVMIL